jgi:hypothetical protein
MRRAARWHRPAMVRRKRRKSLHSPEQEDNFVRIKIASALGLGKRMIPMLANTAEMPRSGDLPLPLKLPGATRSRTAPRVLRPIQRFPTDLNRRDSQSVKDGRVFDIDSV